MLINEYCFENKLNTNTSINNTLESSNTQPLVSRVATINTEISVKPILGPSPITRDLHSTITQLVSPHAPVIPSLFKFKHFNRETKTDELSVQRCDETHIDTGNVDYNVVNDILADILVSLGGKIEEVFPITLIGYEHTEQDITKSITVDRLTLMFEEGNKTFEDVSFLVIPSNGHTNTEAIMSNCFLEEHCKYKIIPQLASHIKTFLGFDHPNTEKEVDKTVWEMGAMLGLPTLVTVQRRKSLRMVSRKEERS